MNIEDLVYYQHQNSGVFFALDGPFNYLDHLSEFFIEPSSLRECDTYEVVMFEVDEKVYLEYYEADQFHRLYFKREEDIEEFLKLINDKLSVSIVISPDRYWAMLEDKRSARSGGTY